MEPTTSAKSTVTCLYSAGADEVIADPQAWQKRASLVSAAVPHELHNVAGTV
jgi:hypothetical protein